MQENLVQKIVEEVLQQVLKNQSSPPHDGKIPIGVSARHVHLHKQKLNSSLVKIISSHRNSSFHSQGNLLRRKL